MRLRLPSVLRRLSAIGLLLGLAACSHEGRPDPGRRYRLTGLVLEGAGADGQVTVAHDAVDGLMPAMTMPFSIRGATQALLPDDHITATLVIGQDSSWLENVVIVSRGSGPVQTPADEAVGSKLGGVVLPEFRLRDQHDKPFRIDALKGRVVLVTFIYTRCPLPDYCPRLMSHLAAIRHTLEADPAVWRRVHLVAVSFDPTFDTPPVLRAYGERFINGPDPFSQVTLATGAETEVQALAGFFGVRYREEGGQISHSLATGIVAGDGRVAAVFPSNTWSPDDAVSVIRREVGRLPAS